MKWNMLYINVINEGNEITKRNKWTIYIYIEREREREIE